MKVLILGHTGLLGNCLHKFLSEREGIKVCTTDKRWPNQDFTRFLKGERFDWVINCIAQVPQSQPEAADMFVANVGLPAFLSGLGANIIHPSSNDLSGNTEYSLSKLCAEQILLQSPNAYIIRASIVGIEVSGSKSLLSWFLSMGEEGSIKGFTNHYWNGVTTLTWASICWEIIAGRRTERLIVPYSDTVSKHELLLHFKEVFKKRTEIIPVENPVGFRENADTNLYMGAIGPQLESLKKFYGSFKKGA